MSEVLNVKLLLVDVAFVEWCETCWLSASLERHRLDCAWRKEIVVGEMDQSWSRQKHRCQCQLVHELYIYWQRVNWEIHYGIVELVSQCLLPLHMQPCLCLQTAYLCEALAPPRMPCHSGDTRGLDGRCPWPPVWEVSHCHLLVQWIWLAAEALTGLYDTTHTDLWVEALMGLE